MTDKSKLVAAAVLVAVGIGGYYWLGDSALLLRILAVVAGILAGAAVAWASEPGRQFAGFAGEAIAEVKKVVWPTRKETMQKTAAGFGVVGGVGGFLWGSGKARGRGLFGVILGREKKKAHTGKKQCHG